MKTDLIIILDRSGSMEPLRSEIIGSFNHLLEEQTKVADEARLTLVQFDDIYEMLTEGTPLPAAKPLDMSTYVPRGMTALYDAIGKTIGDQGQRFETMAPAERPEKVVMTIFTDGVENASKHFTREQIQALVTRQQNEWNWTVYFVGANQDARAEAGKLGIIPDSALDMGWNKQSIKGSFAVLDSAIKTSRSTGKGYAYTVGDRAKSKVP